MITEELREGYNYVAELVRELDADAEGVALDDDAQTAWDEGLEYLEATRAQIEQIEARDKALEQVRRFDVPGDAGARDFQVPKVVEKELDVRSASQGEVRDASMKIIEESRWLAPEIQEAAERAINKRSSDYDGDKVARKLVATERPEYRSAFLKNIMSQSHLLTEDERRAELEVRAMSGGTTTEGGFGVPVLIDPTVLITDGTGLLGIVPHCRVETITTDQWKGVSAGNTAWSFDAEAAEVSDDASTFAQPTVAAHMARGFIPHSIEIGMDYPNFASEMSRLLSDGYQDLLAEKLMVGTGSDQPWGIFITTTTTVDVTTDNTFGAEDIDKVWAALPEKFRARSTWVMDVSSENNIRGFGSGTATSRFTVDQTREGISLLNGRPVVLSDYAPAWAGTDAAKILAVGDFQNFVIAQRAGMTVEVVPHLFGTTNNRPTGQRGLFAHARVGSDKVVLNAFRVLKNQTT